MLCSRLVAAFTLQSVKKTTEKGGVRKTSFAFFIFSIVLCSLIFILENATTLFPFYFLYIKVLTRLDLKKTFYYCHM